ncbi:EF-hand domain-containing protein [Tropilaelaps mercedesae]|uniref:EF-hand domain-containing protein n=1 Tax=Tropilaelaps mercedesae TaxID=418985 RepID=A0A1V9XL79_9ACAR|nr:EF-hand domain-containing protein [Tropilaelaps mercedesae]
MTKPHHELKILQDFNPFEEFAPEEIDKYKAQFDKFDVNGDHVLDFMELKRMMEILGAPQTHVQLKDMIKEIDEDFDGSINFTEFLLIFKKARDGELSCDGGLITLARMAFIDVSQTGVSGAKDFFEAKVKVLTDSNLARRASNANSVSTCSNNSKSLGPAINSNTKASTKGGNNNNQKNRSDTKSDKQTEKAADPNERAGEDDAEPVEAKEQPSAKKATDVECASSKAQDEAE